MASRNARQPSAPPTPSRLHPYSCLSCRRKKKKCDRISPCTNCRTLGVECLYVPRRPSTRQPAFMAVSERIRHLEHVINHMKKHLDRALIPEETESSPHSDSTKDVDEIDDLDTEFGRLAMGNGRSRYMNSTYWASLDEEVEDLNSLLQDGPEETDQWGIQAAPGGGPTTQVSILPFGSSNQNISKLHPPAEQIPLFWSLFKHNCDRLIKVLHIPTVEPLVLQTAQQMRHMSRGLEALMMAVYFNVVVSLSPEQCLQVLGDEKVSLIRIYKFATEQALARAGLLETDEIIVLQAFTIFLTAVRIHNSARLMWTLTALLVRLSQNAGIHRDGVHFSLSPFVVEMRRRLWWCICVLESRACEDTGYDATITPQSVDTQLPLNVNDSDLFPDMTQLPQPRVGPTDMIFSVLRFENTKIFRRLQYMSADSTLEGYKLSAAQTFEKKTQAITEFQSRIQKLYLKHLDLSDPFSYFTSTISRIIFTKMWLVTYHPSLRKVDSVAPPQDTKDRLFTMSTMLIEYWLHLNEDNSTIQWRWLCETYVQWYALTFLLSELCGRTHGEAVERAWKAVDGALKVGLNIHYSSCQAAEVDVCQRPSMEGPGCELYKPLGKLLSKARSARTSSQFRPVAEYMGSSEQGPRMTTSDFFSGVPLHDNLHTPSYILNNPALSTDHSICDSSWLEENPGFFRQWPFGNDTSSDVQVQDDVGLWSDWPIYPQADFVTQ